MSSKQVSILGAGWLGAPLATYLTEKGYTIQLSTASKERYERLKATHSNVFQLTVQAEKVTGDWAAFSQAAILIINIPPNRSSEAEQFAALIPLIAAAPIQHVLFVSSTGVYPDLNRVVTEEEGIERENHVVYKSEQAFQAMEEVSTTVLRLAGLVGGERHPGRFFQRSGMIKNADAPINLVHRVDVLQCIHQVLEKGYWGKVANVCADTHPLKMDFYPTAAAVLDMPAPVIQQQGQVAYKIVSNQKIKGELGITFLEPDLMALLQHWH